MNETFWTWVDPGHLEAHIEDFILSPHELMRLLEPEINGKGSSDSKVWIKRDWKMKEITGYSGLRQTEPGDSSFWAYRKGRKIPSHLSKGKKETTRWITLVGFWQGESFYIHTLYPGRFAPREIHDPSLSLQDLPGAVDFWSRHAIIVEEGDYSLEPAV